MQSVRNGVWVVVDFVGIGNFSASCSEVHIGHISSIVCTGRGSSTVAISWVSVPHTQCGGTILRKVPILALHHFWWR